ncbi:hypothetical protein SNOG_01157 [Parastagonospora nodorum SN15]|uniref:Uncharacterized protein n=1 Tax=Phaeosphaeria nodorum (strain SN15 / ATCC MYA-4574 / FGSC 10173) TaxID=321614 RepID=Q0V4A7_PHANO|nr:hypothetical protein SNOG_01157 [Parastagonospora nodorum SN15]EAT90806.1 hypothetical protein SNOG_01157 [Parastagonospora nodorum SN15]
MCGTLKSGIVLTRQDVVLEAFDTYGSMNQKAAQVFGLVRHIGGVMLGSSMVIYLSLETGNPTANLGMQSQNPTI